MIGPWEILGHDLKSKVENFQIERGHPDIWAAVRELVRLGLSAQRNEKK
jgi:hypothetical protein